MKTWVRRSLNAGALAAGALLVAGAPAHADTTATTAGNVGILNGTQVLLPVQIPVNACGVAAGVLGDAGAGCSGGAAALLNPEWTSAHYLDPASTRLHSQGNVGILNGTQVLAPIQVPVNVCGVAVGVGGDASAHCQGGAVARNGGYDRRHGKHYAGTPGKQHGKHPGTPGRHRADERGAVTESTGGPVTGRPTVPPKGVSPAPKKPDNRGPAPSVPGYQKPDNRTPGQRTPDLRGPDPRGPGHGAPQRPDTTLVTSGNTGVLNGTQVLAPVQVPINVCGVAIGVLGDAAASCAGGAVATMRG